MLQAQRQLDEAILQLNSKQEILTGIVKLRAKTPGNLGHLHVSIVEPTGTHMTVIYHPPPNHEDTEVQVPFDPPLKSIYEVKPLFRKWEAEVKEKYKPPELPVINYYTPPPLFPITFIVIIGLTALGYANFGWGYYADLFRLNIDKYLGRWMLTAANIFAAFMHLISEPLWMAIRMRRHKTPWNVAWKWIVTTMIVGFASVDEYNACVEYERISHIYAQTDVGPLPPRLEQKEKQKTE